MTLKASVVEIASRRVKLRPGPVGRAMSQSGHTRSRWCLGPVYAIAERMNRAEHVTLLPVTLADQADG